jgi:hypothetical protein
MFQVKTTVRAKGACECRRNTARTSGRLRDWYRSLLLAVVGISVTGCSGGSGGGSDTGGNAAGNPPPVGRGTVVVTATDALGAPLAGASVYIQTQPTNDPKQAVTDSNGRAEIKDVLASTISVEVQGPDSFGFAPSRDLAAGATLAVTVATMPTAEATGGIARAWVPAGGVSGDGRTLEFSLQILQAPTSGEYWAYSTDAVRIAGCTPDPSNDVPRFRPDCVAGEDGLDASYEGLAVSVKKVSATRHATPGAAVLLIDQSTNVVVNDPADARLFAAKYFLTLAGESARTVLAAFSSDDPVSGQFSLLPQKPVTVFPLENPQFTADGRSYFATVDQLGALEGGASPLFAAIDRTLDFAAADPQQDAKALVVVTNGRDDTCGTRSECRSILDALVQKSKASGIAIVAVGLGDAAGTADHEALGLLSPGTANGAAYWAPNPKQLPMVLGDVHKFLAGSKDALEVAFRIQSPVVGAFASGRTVIGQVSLEVCPWDCFYTVIPFVVQVP